MKRKFSISQLWKVTQGKEHSYKLNHPYERKKYPNRDVAFAGRWYILMTYSHLLCNRNNIEYNTTNTRCIENYPVTVIQDTGISRCKIDTKPASTCAQNEDIHTAVQVIKLIYLS